MAYMTKMTRRKIELLEQIEKSTPMSIYQLAQITGRNYRRVFDHVRDLSDAGLVNIRRETRNGRQLSIVEHPCHQRLRHLDEMFIFRQEINATL